MIRLTTLKTEGFAAPLALYLVSSGLLYPDNHGAVCTRTQLELAGTLHEVPAEVVPVFVSRFFTEQQRKHEVLWCSKRAVLSHARDTHTQTILDKY